MKTTLEIPEPLFRRAKALAARRGVALKQLVNEAILEKVEGSARTSGPPAWRALSGGLKSLRKETARIAVLIAEDSEQLDPGDE